MTTRVSIKNHGHGRIKVVAVSRSPEGARDQSGAVEIAPDEEHQFNYVHSTQDLRIEEVKPNG